jgi:iron uptake system EfeUOB component EfeO/EfeM
MLTRFRKRAAATALTVVAVGAGAVVALGGGSPPPAAAGAAPTLDTRVAVSGNIPTARPADFDRPIATYRRHVRSRLTAMLGAVDDLSAAVARGDAAGARRAWLAADASYESIGAAYGAFGDLDAAINGRPGGLQGGVDASDFTGLHRIELALWGRNDLPNAAAAVRRLRTDVRALRKQIGSITIEPLDYALRSHEVLEDSLQLQLAGVANRWSESQLTALRANVEGTEVVYGSLRAMVRRRNPGVAARADSALTSLRRVLRDLEQPGGGLPRWSELSQRQQERVNGLTAGAAERLAYVPDIVDPRPPRPPKSAFGQETPR